MIDQQIENKKMMPSLYISHGSPNRVMGQSPTKIFLESLAEILEKPKAIVIFSAHWFSHEMEITLKETSGNERASTPLFSASYHGNYPTHQPKWLTDRIVTLLHENNVTHSTSHRALDHGAWSVLALSYPGTDIPVIGMSLPIYQDLKDYFALGKMLKVLRQEEILIIGSGSATHNLSALSHSQTPPNWAVEFVSWLQGSVANNDYSALINPYRAHQSSPMAHPTLDH